MAQAYQALKVSLCEGRLDGIRSWSWVFKVVSLVLQDKIAKEVNFILSNQETIQNQISQLEAAVKHMEVN